MTNWWCITESQEKLAEMLTYISQDCKSGGEGYCTDCGLKKCCGSYLLILEWLQEESDG